MQYENERRSRPVWLFILAAILLVLLIVLIGRGCRDEYGETPPMISDTLDVDADTTMSPGGQDEYPDTTNGGGLRDTAMRGPADTVVDPVVPPSPPVSPAAPASPAVTPPTGGGF